MNQTLYIMQGVSGSGKSTLAQAMAAGMPNAVICSTDDYFWVDGKYEFDPKLLSVNHKKNFEQAVLHMKNGRTVIVDNTNITRWQAKPYVKFAVDNNIPVVFIRVTGEFKNVHGVPDQKVAQMRHQMEDLTVESVLQS